MYLSKKPPGGRLFLAGEPLFALVSVVPEDHGDAPQARHAYQRVDDAADGAHLAAEEKRHAVEAEKPTLPQFSAPMTISTSAILSMIFKI